MRTRLVLVCMALALALTASGTTALARDRGGFKTSQPSMVTPVMPGVTTMPLLTVGDDLPSGYQFEAIPDGISLRTKGNMAEVFVNHETSKVPFPFVTAAPSAATGESDFDNSQVSKLVLDRKTQGVLSGEFVIPSSDGFQRFCSNYLVTKKEGFDREILFTNEESPDYVFRQENSWPPPIGDPAEEENGLVIALDVQSGEYQAIYGMGRHNHENNVPVPGYGYPVILSGDDTFTSGPLTIPPGGPNTATSAPAQSQLYSYIASGTDELLADEGELWAFVSDNASFNDYYDFTPGSTQSVSGHFIQVPKDIATGLDEDGTELKAADKGYPLPPTNGSWQRDLRSTSDPQVGIDGPQWVLEYWSQLNNVFQFVRVEDIAYDKRHGMGNVVYVVDSGRGTAGTPAAGVSTNGRVWKMVFDPEDPTIVTSLSVFVEGDNNEVKTVAEVHQPDNIETTQTGLLLTEDPGSSQQFSAAQQASDPTRATTARLWYVPFSGTPQVVLKIDQSTDGDAGVDVDGRTDGNWGAWETTGIIDASTAFGPGAFLIAVQAHSLWVDRAVGPDTFIGTDVTPGDPDFTYKREGGQLLLIRIPGI